MEKLLQWMEYIEDVRQERKVRHKLKDILVIVLNNDKRASWFNLSGTHFNFLTIVILC